MNVDDQTAETPPQYPAKPSGSAPKVQIIADGVSLILLGDLLEGEPLTRDYLRGDDRLVVDIHALASGVCTRSAMGGARKFKELIANPRSEPAAVTLLSWCPRTTMGKLGFLAEPNWIRHLQFPASIKSIKSNATPSPPGAVGIVQKPAPYEEWGVLVRKASDLLLEEEARVLRHSLAGLIAATRIYLGALIEGAADTIKAQRVLSNLQELARDGTLLSGKESARSDMERFLLRLQQHLLLVEKYQPKTAPPQKLSVPKLYLLDDKARSYGWEIVLQELNPVSSVIESWDESPALLSRIQAGDLNDALLLLDCNLGPASLHTGLSYLKTIRSVTLDLPVVLMTAYDDAELAIWALRAGANQFFAKQLHDLSDRNSAEYFRHFVSILNRNPIESTIRHLWRKLLRKYPLQLKPEYSDWMMGQQDYERANSFFRLAFYLLFSYLDGMTWWQWGAGSLKHNWDSTVGRLVTVAIDNAMPQVWKTVKDRNIIGPPKELAKRHSTSLGSVRHGRSLSVEHALKIMDDFLETYEERCSMPSHVEDPGLPDGCPYTTEDLQVSEATPGSRSVGIPPSHAEAGRRGSQELSLGSQSLQQTANNVPTVIVIDDEGDITGWFESLGKVWPNLVLCKSLEDAQQKGVLAEAGVFLIDLYLPDRQGGLDAVDWLKAHFPEVPLLVASASTEAPDALRCLRHGALDFINKSLPYERSQGECEQFAEKVRTRLQMACRIRQSDLGSLWHCFKRFKQSAFESSYLAPIRLQKTADSLRSARASKNLNRYIEMPAHFQWQSLILDRLSLIILTYQSERLRKLCGKALPPPDDRRVSSLLPSSHSTASLIAFLASAIVEALAQWLYCLDTGQLLEPWDWGTKVSIRQWIERVSPNAGAIWNFRNSPNPDPARVMRLLIQTLGTYPRTLQMLDNEHTRREIDPQDHQTQFDRELHYTTRNLVTLLRARWPCVFSLPRSPMAVHSTAIRTWGLGPSGKAASVLIQTTTAQKQGNEVVGIDIRHVLSTEAAEFKVYVTIAGNLPQSVTPRRYCPAGCADLWLHIGDNSAETWEKAADQLFEFVGQRLSAFASQAAFDQAIYPKP